MINNDHVYITYDDLDISNQYQYIISRNNID